jgi:hypothetical protein
VKDAVRVAVRDARAHLVEVPFDDPPVVADVGVGVEVLLEVHVEELEHEVELLILVDDVHEAVGVDIEIAVSREEFEIGLSG